MRAAASAAALRMDTSGSSCTATCRRLFVLQHMPLIMRQRGCLADGCVRLVLCDQVYADVSIFPCNRWKFAVNNDICCLVMS